VPLGTRGVARDGLDEAAGSLGERPLEAAQHAPRKRVAHLAVLPEDEPPEERHHEPPARAGHCHVEQPASFGAFAFLVRFLEPRVARRHHPEASHRERRAPGPSRTVGHEVHSGHGLHRGREREIGDDRDLELQTLGLVDREDAHGVLVLHGGPRLGAGERDALGEAPPGRAEGEPQGVHVAGEEQQPLDVRRGLDPFTTAPFLSERNASQESRRSRSVATGGRR
jgi:hypothetical protein